MAHSGTPEPLNFNELIELSEAELAALMSPRGNKLAINFPMTCVGSTNDPSDIASDYLDAMYFGERMAETCSAIRAQPIYLDDGRMLMRFDMTAKDLTPFIRELRRLIPGFDPDGDLDPDIRDEVADFEDRMFKTKLHLPELGDSYLANFLAGTQYYENKRYWRKKHPTWRWGFWRSFAADSLGAELYTSSVSESAWIVLGGRTTVERLLAEYGGFSAAGAKLHEAASIRLDQHPHLLVASQAAVLLPSSKLGKAVACWRQCIAPEQARAYYEIRNPPPPPGKRPGWPSAEELRAIHEESPDYAIKYLQKHRGNWEFRYGFTWAMTESGDAIVCGDDNVSFVAFIESADRLRPEPMREFISAAEHVVDTLRDHAGMKATIPLDWASLTPESFEDLCYDVVLRSGRFDEKSLRKHGKTRSRDGGRDIEAHTLHRFDQPSVKWIFQCKFITNGTALSGGKVNVADVVDQHAAGGFGVMTNEVIDSTLYDKLDAIAANRKLETDMWDGRRLQRFVMARRDLMDRYFPST